MSESLSDAAREAAQGEALKLYPMFPELQDPPFNRSRRRQQKAYIKGQVDLAGRLPSREQIATVAENAGTSWDSYNTGQTRAEAQADAVLALIREHVTAT